MKWVEARASTTLETHPGSLDYELDGFNFIGLELVSVSCSVVASSGDRCFDITHHLFYHYQLDDVLGQCTTRQTNGRLATKMQNGGTWYRFLGANNIYILYYILYICTITYISHPHTIKILMILYTCTYQATHNMKHRNTDANYCSTKTDADYCLSIHLASERIKN